MTELLSAPTHLLCVAGPDAGAVVVPSAQGEVLGRGLQVGDRLTSRRHALVRAVGAGGRGISRSGFTQPGGRGRETCGATGERVQLTDLRSANGVFVGRKFPVLPGFARSFGVLRRVRSAVLKPGQVAVIGANLWEVKSRPETLDLEVATAWDDPQRSRMRIWMLLIPMISLMWILSRFLGVRVALGILGGVSVLALYIWGVVRSRRRPQPRWGIIYGLELPARPASNKTREWTLDLSPAPTLRHVRIGPVAFVRPRFRRGRAIKVQTPATVALHDATHWEQWTLAQALTHARLDGIDAQIPAGQHAVCGEDGEALLTVQSGARGDYVLECPKSPPLRVKLPAATQTEGNAGVPECVPLEDLPAPTGTNGLRVPIGVDHDGVVYLDLVADGPHALVAGTTGSGKSEALRTWMLQLARLRTPQQLRLVLIDYKGGAAFRDLVGLKHVEGLLTDLEPEHTARAIAGLAVELTEREAALSARGFSSLDDWERTDPSTAPPRIVCVIDEFRAMIRTHPETLDDLVDLAARGRSLGMHLIAATQSPGGVVTPAMRANLTLRVCLRTAGIADSMEVLATTQAAELPRIPGRSVIEVDEPRVVQWAFSDEGAVGKHLSKHQCPPGSHPRPTLWKPPLSALTPGTHMPELAAPANTFAWVDDVATRSYVPLTLGPEPLGVVGSAPAVAPIIRAGANASGALVIKTREMDVNQAANLMEHATRLQKAVVVDNLGELLRQSESWSIGVGVKWWKKWLRGHKWGLLVAVEPEDYNLVRTWRHNLLGLTGPQARAMALPREVINCAKNDNFIIYPWAGERAASIALVGDENMAKPIAKRPELELPQTATELLPQIHVRKVCILGQIDKIVLKEILEFAGKINAEAKEIPEIDLVSKGYKAAPDVLTVVGEVPPHAFRNVQVPPYVNSQTASNSGLWLGICDAWYKLTRFT